MAWFRPLQVEEIGDPPGDHVGKFARHRVLDHPRRAASRRASGEIFIVGLEVNRARWPERWCGETTLEYWRGCGFPHPKRWQKPRRFCSDRCVGVFPVVPGVFNRIRCNRDRPELARIDLRRGAGGCRHRRQSNAASKTPRHRSWRRCAPPRYAPGPPSFQKPSQSSRASGASATTGCPPRLEDVLRHRCCGRRASAPGRSLQSVQTAPVRSPRRVAVLRGQGHRLHLFMMLSRHRREYEWPAST